MINLYKNFPAITAFNAGSVALNNCTIKNNPTTSNTGGAISSNIPVILNGFTMQNNTDSEVQTQKHGLLKIRTNL